MAVKHLLCFLNGTISYELHMTKCSILDLMGFSDADWGGSSDDRKSTEAFLCDS